MANLQAAQEPPAKLERASRVRRRRWRAHARSRAAEGRGDPRPRLPKTLDRSSYGFPLIHILDTEMVSERLPQIEVRDAVGMDHDGPAVTLRQPQQNSSNVRFFIWEVVGRSVYRDVPEGTEFG